MRVAVLLSGGVDSSVALALLKDQGYDVTAFYLKIWLDDETAFLGECPWEEDLKWCRAVCEKLDVPLEILNLQKDYWEEVVSYAVNELKSGRTPNPDMMCNRQVKFGKFYQKVDKWCEERNLEPFDKVASGHYAKIEMLEGRSVLKMAPDPIKDQTYFLARLSEEQLERAMFPIGDYSKIEVRELAQKFDLANKERKDSQGVCFLGKIKFREFVKVNLGEKKGDFVEFETGKKVGEHHGFWFYTLGQRRNLRVDNGPWFVVKKDPAENIVYISRSYFEDDKPRDLVTVGDFNWYQKKAAAELVAAGVQVKLRHGEQMYQVLAIRVLANGCWELKIDGQDQGIAAGQFVVFYLDGACIGSGVIG